MINLRKTLGQQCSDTRKDPMSATEVKPKKRKARRGKLEEASTGESTKKVKTQILEEREPDETARTVYCEGLSYECSDDEVTAFFTRNCGTVVSLRIPRYQDSGRPRGFCLVEFATVAAMHRAIAVNGAKLRGRYLKIDHAKRNRAAEVVASYVRRSQPEGCKTIFVRNLPYDVSVDTVRGAFSTFGAVADVRLAVWNHTKRQKGFGYVQFIKQIAAKAAVCNQASIQVEGRPVYVDYEATAIPKKSYRTTDGIPWAKTKVGKTVRRTHTYPPK